MNQVDPYRPAPASPRELAHSKAGKAAVEALRTQAGVYAADQFARAGGAHLRPVVVPGAIYQGWQSWGAPEDGSVAWVDEDEHRKGIACKWDSWEWWVLLWPSVRFTHSWCFPPPDKAGLTESADTNVWGEMYERYSTPAMFYFESEALSALDELGYTENQEPFGGPEGVADFGARGEWHRYHLRRWNDGTMRYRFSDPGTAYSLDFELVDADGATVRKATCSCTFTQLIEITESYPGGDAGDVVIEVDDPTDGAGAAATDLLITSAAITGDYDGDWAVPGEGGFPSWPESYEAYWAPTDSNYHEQKGHSSASWVVDNPSSDAVKKVHGLKISGQGTAGVLSPTVSVVASLYYAPDVRACG